MDADGREAEDLITVSISGECAALRRRSCVRSSGRSTAIGLRAARLLG